MKLPDVLVIYNNSNPIKRTAYGDIEKIYKRLRLEHPLLILVTNLKTYQRETDITLRLYDIAAHAGKRRNSHD